MDGRIDGLSLHNWIMRHRFLFVSNCCRGILKAPFCIPHLIPTGKTEAIKIRVITSGSGYFVIVVCICGRLCSTFRVCCLWRDRMLDLLIIPLSESCWHEAGKVELRSLVLLAVWVLVPAGGRVRRRLLRDQQHATPPHRRRVACKAVIHQACGSCGFI